MLFDFILKHFRGKGPSWLNRKITPIVQIFTALACTHPIRTITLFLVLASCSYVGLLETSLFEAQTGAAGGVGQIDFAYLKDGSRTLSLGKDSNWQWREDDIGSPDEIGTKGKHFALVTLVFPNSLSRNALHNAPSADMLESYAPGAKIVPSTANAFTPISQDSTLAYTIAWNDTDSFLQTIKEIPEKPDATEEEAQSFWLAKGTKGTNGNSGSVSKWAHNAWTEFVDLLKHAESLDISIMFLGYLAMHLTFVSLFMSMRRVGSNFWLAFSTLFSSIFAFCFGLVVTTSLGVPINMVLLSEGLPFLVVTVGFEKPIVLTRAVLSASLAARRNAQPTGPEAGTESHPRTIQQAVGAAVRDKGYEIVRDYAIEIMILIAGASSGVQGGLRQFCFLAAWVLLFDMILLFTFYTAVLCVKLEINRIKRHVALRRHLEDDGVPRRIAENVATSTEKDVAAKSGTFSFFGGPQGDSNVPKFKWMMVGGFFLLNAINFVTIPFRAENKAQLATSSGIQGLVASPMVDPFKVADSGLEFIQAAAIKNKADVVITILPPIKYDPSNAYGLSDESSYFGDAEFMDYIVGARAFESVLKSFEDPMLSKWIVIALTLSLALNGYLFNAARWSIKDSPRGPAPNLANGSAIAPKENGHAKSPVPPAPVYIPKEGDRSKQDCEKMLSSGQAAHLNDIELLDLACRGKIPGYALEKTLDNAEVMTKLQALTRAVKIRRGVVSRTAATREITAGLESSKLPFEGYNYENVHGACCENVIGYLPLPVGVAGPIIIDGQSFYLPMATTEGVLVASTNRGAKAINAGGGVTTVLTGDGMTRGPVVGFATLSRAGEAKVWLDSADGQKVMKDAFNSTSRFARLQTLKATCAGSYLYIRFKTTTGDAMGMNMISKGCEKALAVMQEHSFQDMEIISVSGNYCSDKKPAAINWIDGRGKSVVAEAIIPGDFVRKTLKTDVNALVELNTAKNLIGSAMAGSIGGFNAHAANLVAAMYLATGQDPAQVVESAQCITVMRNYNGNLQISVSMPCLEVGTIGGGTVLEPQQAMLDLLGVRGPHPTNPGENAQKLARIIASAVLAGELSLCSALAAGHLVRAHMAHNRSAAPTRSGTPAPPLVPEKAANSNDAAKIAALAMTPAR